MFLLFFTRVRVAEEAFKAGVDDYLRKEGEPTHYQVLAKRIRNSVEKYRTDEIYRKVVEESRDAIIILKDNRIRFANKSACELIGLDFACLGLNILDYIASSNYDLAPPSEDARSSFEVELIRGNGSQIIGEVTLSKTTYNGETAVLAFIRDISDKKRNTERLEAIYQQAVRLSSAETIQEVSERTLDIMEDVFQNKTITFHVVDGDMLKTLGMRGTQHLDLTMPILGKGVTTKAVREGRSVLVHDTANESAFLRGPTESKSELAVPAISNGEVVGVLNVESLGLGDFNEDDRKLLETPAFYVASTFDRIGQRDRQEIEEETTRRQLNYALGRLDHAEKVTTMVRGELQKNLLGTINASLMLRQHPELASRYADSIDVNADQAHRVSERIRETVSEESLGSNFLEVNTQIRNTLENTFVPRNIRVKTQYDESLLIVEMAPQSFVKVVKNLINNSIEAMPDGGTLSVKVGSHYDAMIEITDTGPGIKKEPLSKLFQPFNTTKKGHSGLGLAYCKKTLESNGGELSLVETGGQGTGMRITLPIRRKL